AGIRPKAIAGRLDPFEPAMRSGIGVAARQYFDAARRFIAPAAPQLVGIGGLSGTGKTILARALAPELAPPPGALVLRSDVTRKALLGADENARLPRAAYADPVTMRVFVMVADQAGRALAAGHSVILDAVYAGPDQ